MTQRRRNLRNVTLALAGFGMAAACAAAGAEPGPELPPVVTTSTTAPCRNSHEPRCGEFRYDPEPVNQPMSVEVTHRPPAPKAGEEVIFTVRVSDDGPAAPGCVNYQHYGEPEEEYSYCTAGCIEDRPRRYGPWDPPPPENSAFTEEFRHVYRRPASYTATFAYNAGDDCHGSPYRSRGTGTADVAVTP